MKTKVRKGKKSRPTAVHVDRKRAIKRDPVRDENFNKRFGEMKHDAA